MRKSNIISLSLLAIILSSNLYSQVWMCDIKLGVKLFKTSFFHTDFEEKKNNTDIIFEYSKKRQSSNACFEPEIFMDFYHPTNEIHFGVGITSYNWISKSNLSGSRVYDIDTTLGTTVDMKLVSRNLQFVVTATREIKFSERLNNSLSSNLIVGIGVNKLFARDGIYEVYSLPGDTTDKYSLQFDTYVAKQLQGSKYSNQLSLALLLKYELCFKNKSTGSSLFNLTFGYQQGFSNFNVILIRLLSPDLKVVSQTHSLGSGFRIGISKTFQFKKVELSQNL